MVVPDPLQTHEHALDVLRAAARFEASGEGLALAIVTATEGGAVRLPGALMAISGSGKSAGYVSGGCIDADVRLNARQALADGTMRRLRYGAGSAFPDIRLPCGGAIEILILPGITRGGIDETARRLQARQPVRLREAAACWSCLPDAALLPDISYLPKPLIRIAGRGADCLALARIAGAAGFATCLQLVDEEDVSAARQAGFRSITHLHTPAALSPAGDDAWTAFVLMFHDREWEVPLLLQAFDGPAFYIGAVGSRKAQERRVQALRDAGCGEAALERLHGPVGLVAGMRDASFLAISVLSEIFRRGQAHGPAWRAYRA